MWKMFSALNEARPLRDESDDIPFSRFESPRHAEDLRPSYTRFASKHHQRKRPMAEIVELPQPRTDVDRTCEVAPTGQSDDVDAAPKFDDNAHLYASDGPTIDVLRQSLPQRFLEAKHTS